MNNFNRRFTIRLITVAAAFILLSACGRPLTAQQQAKNGTYGHVYDAAVSEGDYNCPALPNAVPTEDVNLDGTQHYTVCAAQNSATKALVKGWSSSAPTVCVYPINFISNTQFQFRADRTGMPTFQCYNAAQLRRKEIDFPGAAFNAVVIVDQPLQLQMSRCLVMAGAVCPVRSMARIR